MPTDTEQELDQEMDKDTGRDSTEDTVADTDSEEEKTDSENKEAGEEEQKEEKEEPKEKLYSEEEVENRARSKADTQMSNLWKERDTLRKERDDALSMAESKDFDRTLDILYKEEVDSLGEDEATQRKNARAKLKDIATDHQKNSRYISEAIKAVDRLADAFESGMAERLGLKAKNPIERINNCIDVVNRMDAATLQNMSFEFFLDLREKGLAKGSDKASILKRLTEVDSVKEWEREKNRIVQEYKAKSPPEKKYKPDSGKQAGGTSGKLTLETIQKMSPEEKERRSKEISEFFDNR